MMANEMSASPDDSDVVAASGKKRRDPTALERDAIRGAAERHRARGERVQLKLAQVEGKQAQIHSPHSDEDSFAYQLQDAFGTTSAAFAQHALSAISSVAQAYDAPLTEAQINGALAMVDGLKPNNEIEAALAAQMFASYDLGMEMSRRCKQAGMIEQMTAYGNLAVKLQRTFTAQAEALAKLRRGGEQTVRVEHVHVYDGGQAVVGVVNTGGVNGKRNEQPLEPDLAAALGPTMLGHDPLGNGLPVPRHAERPVSAARGRKSRRSQGK